MDNHTTRSQFQPPFRPEAESPGNFTPLPTTELLPARLKPDRQFASLGPKPAYAPPIPSQRLVIRPHFAFPGKLVRKKRMQLGLFFLLLVSVLFSWFFLSTKAADVTIYHVNAQDATSYISGGGMTFPRQQLSLSYPLPEKALVVFVKVGEEVTPNQPLLKLDPTQLNAQAKQLSDDVAAAQAYLASVSASGNSSAIALAQQQYSLTKSKYNAFVASPLLLHNGNLTSPMRGVVTTVNISPGEVFAANMPLLIIMDESVVIVHVKVPLANLSQVHTGMQAIATPSALPDLNFKGTISAIVPQADPQTDTFEVWVSIDNSSKTLLPGMSVFVRIQAAGRALVVPRSGILSPDKEPVAFVVRNQRAYVQEVHVAGEVRDELLVDAGLARGDTIVLVGQYQLCDGQAVRIQSVEK